MWCQFVLTNCWLRTTPTSSWTTQPRISFKCARRLYGGEWSGSWRGNNWARWCCDSIGRVHYQDGRVHAQSPIIEGDSVCYSALPEHSGSGTMRIKAERNSRQRVQPVDLPSFANKRQPTYMGIILVGCVDMLQFLCFVQNLHWTGLLEMCGCATAAVVQIGDFNFAAKGWHYYCCCCLRW